MSGIPTTDSADTPADIPGAQPPRHGLHQRIPDRIRRAPWALIVLAPSTGAAAALGALAFHRLTDTLTHLFTHPFAGPRDAGSAGPYIVLIAPVLGGLLYGPFLNRFAPGPRGHGLPELMLAASRPDGRVSLHTAVLKALASAVCIGSGGSLGRTGPIVQLGAAAGSLFARLAKATRIRGHLLLACGAAGGVAAAFNAPLAGAFFAVELILRTYTVEAFGAAALAALTADALTRVLSGTASPFLTLPDLPPVRAAQLPLLCVLAAGAAVVSVGFTHVLYLVEDLCTWAWRGPQWLRAAVGGLPLGALLFVLPELYGSGYPVIERVTGDGYLPGFLLLLLVGKILAASLTFAIGGAGGVFAPGLFIGAALGAAYAGAVRLLLPGAAGSAALYALAGMAAVFAGCSRTPATAIALVFEMTGQYAVVPPVMLTVIVTTFTGRLLSQHTIHTLKLSRRGITLPSPVTAIPPAP